MNICPAIGDTVNYPTSSTVLILIFLIFYMHIRGLFVVGFEFILKKKKICASIWSRHPMIKNSWFLVLIGYIKLNSKKDLQLTCG